MLRDYCLPGNVFLFGYSKKGMKLWDFRGYMGKHRHAHTFTKTENET